MITKAYYKNMKDGLPALMIEYDNEAFIHFTHVEVKIFLLENGIIPIYLSSKLKTPPIEIVVNGKIQLQIEGKATQLIGTYTRDKQVVKLVNRYIEDIEANGYVEGISIMSELD